MLFNQQSSLFINLWCRLFLETVPSVFRVGPSCNNVFNTFSDVSEVCVVNMEFFHIVSKLNMVECVEGNLNRVARSKVHAIGRKKKKFFFFKGWRLQRPSSWKQACPYVHSKIQKWNIFRGWKGFGWLCMWHTEKDMMFHTKSIGWKLLISIAVQTLQGQHLEEG